MILKALVDYYDQLLQEHPEKVAPPGWSPQRVDCMLEIDRDGALVNVIPAEDKRGWVKTVPEREKRASGIKANLLCDKPSYLLGVTIGHGAKNSGKPDRDAQCFAAARHRHLALLSNVDSDCARAVVRFFEMWDPAAARNNPAFARAHDTLTASTNLIFTVRGIGEVLDDPAVRAAWNACALQANGEDPRMVCLVTGERAPIARLHPSIKGIRDAPSTGSSLVAFNARAFESYGHEEQQGLNAPVSQEAARSYAAALNYLVAEPQRHLVLGDTTIVYWSTAHDDANSSFFSFLAGGFSAEGQPLSGSDADAELDGFARKLASGKAVGENELDLNATFYVLGVAPNVAMLSTRFFHRDTFGNVVKNLTRHCERIAVAHAPWEGHYLSPRQLLSGVENPNAKKPTVTSELGGALMRAILQDLPYPEALFQNTLLRIRSSQNDPDKHAGKISQARAAIIKAYLLKNRRYSKEDITVELNEQRNETAYCLGRAFSLLEQIQEAANGKATIANRYLDAACATPATVFPTLLRLATAHLGKIEGNRAGLSIYFKRLLEEVLSEERVAVFPRRLSPTEQGDFFLGYYHQDKKRFDKQGGQTEQADNGREA